VTTLFSLRPKKKKKKRTERGRGRASWDHANFLSAVMAESASPSSPRHQANDFKVFIGDADFLAVVTSASPAGCRAMQFSHGPVGRRAMTRDVVELLNKKGAARNEVTN
jgi:hypothetical protein